MPDRLVPPPPPVEREAVTSSVHFAGDGVGLSTTEYARLLVQLAESGRARGDAYSTGGVVDGLEQHFAELLQKERAVFLATGTLANNLAIRHLASGTSRVLVAAESHIYRDSYDCVAALSHLNLVPLGHGYFTLAQIEEACRRAAVNPFPVAVGAICIECPIRRRHGEVFPVEEMRRISQYGRRHGIGMHLDGARLLIASAYTGIQPAEYAALFDTVYISLYKGLNSGGGAILAGPKVLVERTARDQKMFGAGLCQAWPYAAVALHYAEGFLERFGRATRVALELFALLDKHPQLKVEPFVGGTNIYKLKVKGVDAAEYREALWRNGIQVRDPEQDDQFPGALLVVNETLNRAKASELAAVFIHSLTAKAG